MENSYRNYAFISYSRKDLKIAKWLQDKLEGYRLPAKLRKENSDMPKKIFPVFRDKTDLSGIDLAQSLQAELENSRYLIVICSPNSVASEWVNKEIEYFKALGREAFIIPFIVDGVPFSENECFPDAIKSMSCEPLGIDYRSSGKRHAFLQLVATMLEIRLDTLIERDKKRRRKYRAAISLASLVCIIVSGCAVYYNVPHSKYYADVIYQQEIPCGIYELTREELQTRATCFKLTTKRDKVIRLEKVNALGSPTQNLVSVVASYPIQEYNYNNVSGELVSVLCYDEFSNIKLIKNISPVNSDNEIAIDFVIPSDVTEISALSADLIENSYSESDEKSEITRMLNTYNSDGLLVKTLYQKTYLNIPSCDMNGIYGQQYEYNSFGQPVTVSYLNRDGEIFDCRYGWAKAVYTYNEKGLITGQQFKDKNDKNVWNKNVSLTQLTYDENNNLVGMFCYDEDGKLCDTSFGYAMRSYEYNEKYLLAGYSCYNAEKAPAYDENGVHKYVYTLNDKGQIVEFSFYDTYGKPTYSQAYQCFRQKNIFDSEGRIIQLELYNADGKPMYSSDCGASVIRVNYDEFGFVCELHYLDENHKPVMTKYGYASWYEYRDDLGRLLRYETRDIQGNLVCGNNNFAATECTYDAFGNVESVVYFNEKNELGYHSDGFSVVTYEYENGNVVQERYYDHNFDPINNIEGYHACIKEYENGNCVCKYYVDTNNKLILSNKELYSLYMYEYDEKGNVCKIVAGEDDVQKNMLIINREFDKQGNIVREERNDVFNEICVESSVTAYNYDIYGNVLAEQYAEDGKHIYTCLYERDSKGKLLTEYKLNGEKLPYKYDDPSYCNMCEFVYDEFGNETEYKEYHINDLFEASLLSWEKAEYDSRGNIILLKECDDNGDVYLYEDTYAVIRNEYNHRGDKITLEFLDVDMQLTQYLRFSVVKMEYNFMGKVTKKTRLDYNRELISSRSTGIPAVLTYEYDHQGKLICEMYYDENNNLFAEDDGVAKIEYLYDSFGNSTTIKYDENGNVITKETDIIIAEEILDDSIAEQLGVCSGDVLLVWGDWNYLDELESGRNIIASFEQELEAKENSEKKLVVARYRSNGEYYIFEFMLPAGKAGIALSSSYATTDVIDSIAQAYTAF